jgi:hypothetical protein
VSLSLLIAPANLTHIGGRGAIAPTRANEIYDICHVLVGEPPGKDRHCELRRRASRARRLRSVQNDGYERLRVPRLYHRIAGEAWEALARIKAALRQAADRLRKRGFQTHTSAADAGETKLLVRRGCIEIKVEVNFVMRGTVAIAASKFLMSQ